MQHILWLHILYQIVDPQPIAQIAAVKVHAVAQMVNTAVMAVDNTMHFDWVFCCGGRFTKQIFGEMAPRKACGPSQQNPHRTFLSRHQQAGKPTL
jgi:hypothetical protein